MPKEVGQPPEDRVHLASDQAPNISRRMEGGDQETEGVRVVLGGIASVSVDTNASPRLALIRDPVGRVQLARLHQVFAELVEEDILDELAFGIGFGENILEELARELLNCHRWLPKLLIGRDAGTTRNPSQSGRAIMYLHVPDSSRHHRRRYSREFVAHLIEGFLPDHPGLVRVVVRPVESDRAQTLLEDVDGGHVPSGQHDTDSGRDVGHRQSVRSALRRGGHLRDVEKQPVGIARLELVFGGDQSRGVAQNPAPSPRRGSGRSRSREAHPADRSST